MSFSRDIYRLSFECSPVILTRGIAQIISGGKLPIIALTESINFVFGLLGGDIPDIDRLFAHWQPLPGSTLQKNNIGMYPFANQVIAANAIIKEPLNISLVMHCPVQIAGGYYSKLATIAAMKATIDYHNQNGGTYTIATPSYIYTDCVLQSITDVTNGGSEQAQVSWQFDFLQPLISATQAQNLGGAMSAIEGGLPITGDLSWSSVSSTVGNSLSGFAGSIPGLSGLIGTISS